MSNDPQVVERRRAFERRLQTALLTGALLLIGWMARTLVEVDKRTAVIGARVASMDVQLSTTYRVGDAARDKADAMRRFESIERRMREFERVTGITTGAPWQ